ncbi:MAG: hypothetical protein KUL86_12850 [Castellaniella sp.]|nr:hypothetical protein [Castellaniella sp.]
MLVSELITALQKLPADLPVMVCAEGGIDQPLSAHIITAIKHSRDWSGTPVGQYREANDWLDDTDTAGNPFQAVLIDLDDPHQKEERP